MAMSGGDEIDSILECIVTGVCEFLLLGPIVTSA
jgi:hypothetical protein